nr:lipolytic enzyme [uncultured bacterium]
MHHRMRPRSPLFRNWLTTLTAMLLLTSTQLAVGGPVRIESGLIEGEVLDADANLRVYRGVPYAAPPVGDLRWKSPQTVIGWDDVRPAIEFGPACPQPNSLALMLRQPMPNTSEDCLYLNVWTAAESPDAKLPVMVWIHGGGLNLGWSHQSEYDGTAFAKQGVVLVSINYRLGPSDICPSGTFQGVGSRSFGQLWVPRSDRRPAVGAEEREAFGGDPGNVTIFGESAGGTSVVVLGATPLAKGLFHRMIAQSPWVTETNFAHLREPSPHVDSAEALGTKWIASAVDGGEDDLLSTMRGLSADQLVAKMRNNYPVVVTVDGWFLPDTADAIFTRGLQNDVPLIIGTNADEGTMFQALLPYKTAEDFQAQIRAFYGEHADDVLQQYPVSSANDLSAAVNAYIGDTWFVRGTRNVLRGMEKASSPAFQYYFTRKSPVLPNWGAHHAAELRYVFRTLDHESHGDTDRKLSDAMIGYWVQFAKTGDPNVDGLPDWPTYESSTDQYLELGKEIRVGTALRKDACDVLERVRSSEQRLSASGN